MRDEFLTRTRRMHPTSTTSEAILEFFGYMIKIWENRERCEQEDVTVSGRGQEVVAILLQFTSMLACYYVSPPLELGFPKSAIRSEENVLYIIRLSDTKLLGNDLSRKQLADSISSTSSKRAHKCRRCVSTQRRRQPAGAAYCSVAPAV